MYFREKKSVREIVRLTSLSRNTVRKWLKAAVLVFPVIMLTSLVYLGEHWVIDGLVGWAIVGGSLTPETVIVTVAGSFVLPSVAR